MRFTLLGCGVSCSNEAAAGKWLPRCSPCATYSASSRRCAEAEGRTNIRNAASISERPATAEDRAIPGHWEGDLSYGNATSQIATLVERQSRFVMLVKVASKDSEAVVDALIRHANKLPRELLKWLTWDRGSDMAGHHRFTVATDIEVYFCDPQHPSQRRSNENTNGLLRQYFPKDTDLSAYSDQAGRRSQAAQRTS